jgi:ferredoxin
MHPHDDIFINSPDMTFTTLFLLLLCTQQPSLAFVPSNTGACHSLASSNNKPRIVSMMVEESSTSMFTGVDDSVDMNQYNLPVDQAIAEWTANLKAASALEESGAYLGARSSKDIFVDSVQVSFPRLPDSGLGILLQEIAGGREDGLGITVVSGLVEGGASHGSGILAGDSISAIMIQQGTSKETIAAVATECLGYDATVDAILSLPAARSSDEMFVLSVKRLRRKPRVNLTIQFPPHLNESDVTLELFSGENLRRAMLTRGVKLNDALSRRFDSGGTGDCGAEGTCATCVVSVVKGSELLNPQSIQEQQMLRSNSRWRLGCRAIVGYGFQQGDITLRLNPKQWEAK